jgi:hypothetical protein
VAAQQVEAEPLDLGEQLLELLDRGRLELAARVVVLVQDPAQLDRLAVEQDQAVLGLHGAEAGRHGHRVGDGPVASTSSTDPE